MTCFAKCVYLLSQTHGGAASSLQRHRSRPEFAPRVETARPIACPHCSRFRATPTALSRHVSLQHPDANELFLLISPSEKPCRCASCPPRFRSSCSGRGYHVHREHPLDACVAGEESDGTEVPIHAALKRLQSLLCGGQFANEQNLHRHSAEIDELRVLSERSP